MTSNDDGTNVDTQINTPGLSLACLAAAAAVSYHCCCRFRYLTWERAPGRISSSATFSPILLFVPMLREATPGPPPPPPFASKRAVLFASAGFAADAAAWEGGVEPMLFPRVDVDIAEQRAPMCWRYWCCWERTRRFSGEPARIVAVRPATPAAARTMDMLIV